MPFSESLAARTRDALAREPGITEKKIDFILAVSTHRLNLLAELLPKSLKHCGHCLRHHPPTTMPTAL